MQLPTREIEMSYDYKKVVSFLIETAEKHLSKKFQIPKNEQGIIFAILAWFGLHAVLQNRQNVGKRELQGRKEAKNGVGYDTMSSQEVNP